MAKRKQLDEERKAEIENERKQLYEKYFKTPLISSEKEKEEEEKKSFSHRDYYNNSDDDVSRGPFDYGQFEWNPTWDYGGYQDYEDYADAHGIDISD